MDLYSMILLAIECVGDVCWKGLVGIIGSYLPLSL
jgi:hypothetical protein